MKTTTRWCLDQTVALALYAGFAAACGGGESELSACNANPEVIPGTPTITMISPTSGPPGTTVVVTGTGFLQIDDRFEAAYGDFALTCDHGTMDGQVMSDTRIELIIPEQASLPGYVYLLMDGLTVTRSPERFELDAPGLVVVTNQSQFPLVSVSANWEPILETGDRIDVAETRTLSVEPGPLRLELCTGEQGSSGALETWACVSHTANLAVGQQTNVTVAPIPASEFLAGEWVATWNISEEETDEEHLRIDPDGYWELRYDRRVVDSGTLLQDPWEPYARDFAFSLRPADRRSEASVPVRSFVLESPRAGDRVTFYRAE